MKKLLFARLLGICLPLTLSTACEGLFCTEGTLEYTNTSLCTTQEIIIDGVSQGLVFPGEMQLFTLERGRYSVRVLGDGICGYGCTPGQVSISACKTSYLSCSN